MMTIALEGIRVHAYHGVYEEEKISGNEFVVDVYLKTAELAATQTDRLEDTLDYAEVYKFIVKEMEQPVDLLEYLVSGMGKRLLAKYSVVQKARLRVSKLNPKGMTYCERTYVEMDFIR